MAVAIAQLPLPLAAISRQFEDAVLILGAVLVGGALASGIARRSFLSLTAAFVLVASRSVPA